MDMTCYSILSPNRSLASTVTITVNNIEIECVNNCKYLGINIDNRLNGLLLLTVRQKLKSLVGIFYKMRHKLPDWCLCNIYFAFVRPYLLYGLEVHGNTYPSYLDKLTIWNNKLLRILYTK